MVHQVIPEFFIVNHSTAILGLTDSQRLGLIFFLHFDITCIGTMSNDTVKIKQVEKKSPIQCV